MKQQFYKTPLVLGGQADDLRFIDGPVRGLLSGGDHEIADASALEFCGPLDDSQRLGRDASFYSGGSVC